MQIFIKGDLGIHIEVKIVLIHGVLRAITWLVK